MGIKEGVLALADELEAFEDGDCEECSLYGQPECKGHLSCMEIMAWYAARKMREAVERDGEGATTVSAYDLLSDEDREAIAWVREHGGLDMAASRFESGEIAADMLWGKGHGRFWTTDEFEEEISKRLMPEGMEWPRFEDNAPVKFGDMALIDGDADMVEAVQIWIHGKPVIYGDNGSQQLEKGERVKRPAVLAADGEPLEAGQTVWNVNNGMEFTVSRLPNPGEYQAVEVRYRNGSSTSFDPDQLTHQRPVLDADGVLCREGDEVWEVRSHRRREIIGTNYCDHRTGEPLILCDGDDAVPIPATCVTHTKPEPPDSRQAVVNEIGDEMAARIDLLVSSGRWSDAD